MDTPNKKKIGLALGSGGVKGIAHVGAIKALVENNIPIDIIAGTSIGALVAVHYALNQDIGKLEEIIIGSRREKLISFFEPTLRGGLIKGKKVEKLLNIWLEDAEFKDLKIPTKIVATDLVSGEQVVFSEGKLVPAIRASMAVPTVFAPYIHNGQILVDGGISNPVPDDLVKEMGADIVISVNLDNYRRNGLDSHSDLNLLKTARRSLDILRLNLAKYSLKNSDIIIEPHIQIAGFKSWARYFTKDFGPQLYQIGQDETGKHIDKIRELIK